MDNADTGVLFPNDKGGVEARPDNTGKADLICPHCSRPFQRRIAAWIRTGTQSGKEFLSLKFDELREFKKEAPVSQAEELDDDIPFN